MLTWQTTAVVCVLLATLGGAADLWIGQRGKTKLHDGLVHIWYRLSETPVPDLAPLLAHRTLYLGSRLVGGPGLSMRALLILFLVSFLLSLNTFTIGYWLDQRIVGEAPHARSIVGNLLYFLSLRAFWLGAVPVNLAFDAATVLVTIKVLQVVRSTSGALASLAIAVDLLIAILLACLCVIVFDLVEIATGENALAGSFINNAKILMLRQWGAVMILLGYPVPYEEFDIGHLFFSATTLIPTVICLTLLYAMLVAKPILSLLRFLLMGFLNRTTEPEPTNLLAFTMVASVFNVVAVSAATAHHFASS